MLLSCAMAAGQSLDPYLNGVAFAENCFCYTLTNDQPTQAGSVWNKTQIDLRQSFDFKFNVNLGSKDGTGADGIAFVLQNISLSIGTTGEGMGFGGVVPSIGIPIDTWQNGNQNDPSYDHISINRDGDVNHTSANNLAGPVSAIDGIDNIEDGQFHVLRVTWNATTQKLTAQIDGVERVAATIDMVGQVFGNNPMVYWGFTAATGGSSNRQRFCTSLNAGFGLDANQLTCFPATIAFRDKSLSFGSIVKWYWDFGDGTIDSVQSPAPHTYAAPGIYRVKLNILGNNGCVSDTFVTNLTIGSKPTAAFEPPPPPYCNESVVPFKDLSQVQYGTIDTWEWQLDNNPVAVQPKPDFGSGLTYGAHTVKLQVRTKEGCVSDPVTQSITMNPSPVIDMAVGDTCFRTPAQFASNNLTPQIPIRQWYWQTGDGARDSSATTAYLYKKGGVYNVQVFAQAENGCYSDTLKMPINIFETKAFAGNDTAVIMDHPLPLHGSGGVLYQWSPATGLSDPNIADPVAMIRSATYYVLKAYTPMGCATTDTIKIEAYKGPAIYVPNVFSPNGDNNNDRFRVKAVGISDFSYLRIYNRYGQLVFNSTSMKDGWDGTFHGQAQPVGTYVWMVQGKDIAGQLHVQRGTVNLIR
ncbi:lectin-like domain-containing protein [Paraflavitalea pollutisoli]|uniref:lectin-like domain-containing protein n=1 Tax=Paraflavitalea pollutisoli TaxID=3034143 RepID=UPI0023EC1F72|nr:PKD domain-containing protein [Paraflavitalea sp. H1-2-19X]